MHPALQVPIHAGLERCEEAVIVKAAAMVGDDDALEWPFPPEIAQRLDGCVSFGNTAIIELQPPGDRVKKSPHPQASTREKRWQTRQLRREVEIYQRLPPSHDRLIRMIDYSFEGDRNGHVVLEYMAKGSLRSYLESSVDISDSQRLQWCVEAAEAVALLHAHGIIHADVKPDNMLLDARLGLRIIDMSGSSIDGETPLCLESTRFFLPRDMKAQMPCSVSTDLFALGSTIYQIVAGVQPYDDLDDDKVEASYARKEFPATEHLLCGGIIRRCWTCSFDSAETVLDALREERRNFTTKATWFSFSFLGRLISACRQFLCRLYSHFVHIRS